MLGQEKNHEEVEKQGKGLKPNSVNKLIFQRLARGDFTLSLVFIPFLGMQANKAQDETLSAEVNEDNLRI